MSTAEKLRVISDLGFKAMRPEIVAVVEAAEHMDVWIEHGCDHFANGQEAVAPFRSALAALEEALG